MSDTNEDDSNHLDLIEMGPTDLLTMLELSEASATTQEDSFLHTINLLNIPIAGLDGVAIVQTLNARVLKCKQMFNHVITDLQKSVLFCTSSLQRPCHHIWPKFKPKFKQLSLRKHCSPIGQMPTP